MTKARTLADFDASTALTGNINLATQVTGLLPLANGGTGATSVPAGEVNTPAFRVRSSTGQTIGSGWTKIQFDTADRDTNSAFDLANERFTVPTGEAGLYWFSWSIENNGKIAGNAMYDVALYKNNVNQTDMRTRVNPSTSGTFDVYNNGGGAIELAVGDYVELFYYQNTGSDVTLEGNYRSFSGFKIT